MRKWIILMIVALLILNSIFLLGYVIGETDRCSVSCVDKGYKDGSCMNLPITQKPCESRGLVTDLSYNLYCKETNEVCCCEK